MTYLQLPTKSSTVDLYHTYTDVHLVDFSFHEKKGADFHLIWK